MGYRAQGGTVRKLIRTGNRRRFNQSQYHLRGLGLGSLQGHLPYSSARQAKGCDHTTLTRTLRKTFQMVFHVRGAAQSGPIAKRQIPNRPKKRSIYPRVYAG